MYNGAVSIARAPFDSPAASPFSGARHGTFSSFDGTPIAYLDMGEADRPTLLLINGVGASALAYANIVRRFAPRFRVVSFDYRGLYRSGRPLGGYDALTITDHARDALALLDTLGIESVHAVGWSMGVQVLLELYRLAGERIESMVLKGGVAGRPFENLLGMPRLSRVAPRALRLLQRSERGATRALSTVVDARWFVPMSVRSGFTHHAIDPALFRELAGCFKSHDMHLLLELLHRMGEHDASDVLTEVRCPNLVMTGSRDFLTPVRVARDMSERLSDSRFVLLPGGTHYALVELPDVINRHLGAFWSEVGAW